MDDEADVLSVIERMLSGCGYAITSVTNGKDALMKIKEQPYDLVLTDIVMKKMNGMELLDEIKIISPETVVILMTGYGSEKAVDAFRKGAIDYILKPFDEQELKIRIQRALEKQRLGKKLKQAEKLLRESEQKYRMLFEEIVSGFALHEIICDEQGKPVDYRTLEVNKAFENIFGVKRENVVGKTFREIVPHETNEWIEIFGKVALTGQPKHYEQYSNTNDKYFEGITYCPKKGQFAVTFNDVTERKRIEEALQKSERRFKELVDLLPQIVFEIDLKGVITFANRLAFTSFGYTQDDFKKGLNTFQMIAIEDRDRAKKNIQRIFNGENSQDNEYTALKKDGTTFPVIISSSLIIQENTTVGLRGIIIDMTEIKKSESLIKESEEKYRTLFEHAGDGIAIAELETGIIVDCNEAMAQLVNRNKTDLIDKPQSLLHPKEKLDGKLTKDFKKLRSMDKTEVHEREIITTDGTIKYVDITAKIFEYRGKKFVQGIFRDITERKKKENELRASEERFSKAFNANPSMMSIMRLSDRKYIYVNDAVTRFSGYTREEVIGKGPSDLNQWGDLMEREEILKLYQEGKNPFHNTEIKYFSKSGDLRRALVASEIIEINGETCLLSTASDITELRRLEEQLQTRQRMDSLGVLAGGIAHDFNNILAGIMGYLDMLTYDSEGLSDTQKEYIKTALKNCQRAADLIRNFQTFSRGVVAERETIDIYFPAQEVFTLLKETTDRLIEKRFKIEPDKFYVTAHPVELNQIFLNLGANAIHAIEDRGAQDGDYIKVTAEDYTAQIKNKSGLSQGDYIHIMFEDNGIGMSEEVQQKAFDPLFTTRKKGTKKGQGLGLAMVYNIVTNILKGQITIESREGAGTTFHIYLSKARPEKFKEIKEPSEIKGGNETILVVDDEETIVAMAEASLQQYGYSVITAADGEQALEVFKAQKDTIGLVILDLTMPKIPGKLVFEQMLILKPDVKVIISSGQSDEDIREGNLAMAKGFTQKPYKLAELAKMIRMVLDE